MDKQKLRSAARSKPALLAYVFAALFGGSKTYYEVRPPLSLAEFENERWGADYDESSVADKMLATARGFVTIPPAVATWTSCTTGEGQTCSFTGTRAVKFGVPGRYLTKVFTGSTPCTNTVFGDPAPGVAKSCSYSSIVRETTNNSAGQAPGPNDLNSLPTINGPITMTSNQVLTGVRVTSTSGPCVIIPSSAVNTSIIGNRLGSCGGLGNGNEGVQIQGGAGGHLIKGNKIHDVSAGVIVRGQHPVVIDRNFVYNIRGPINAWGTSFYQGNIVQFAGVRGGSGQSKITCNVKDGEYRPGLAGGAHAIGDHYSMFETLGIPGSPIEVAWNRILGDPDGNNHESGSGIQTGDDNGTILENGYYWVHHNRFVRTNGTPFSVSGGHDILMHDNEADNRAPTQAWNTGWAFQVYNGTPARSCYNIAFNNNRMTISNLWAFNHDGSAGQGIISKGGCTYTQSGNNTNDAALNAQTYRQIFDTIYTECGSSALPTYTLTQIFPLAVPAVTVVAGKNFTLRERFYGVPFQNPATVSKSSVKLVNSANVVQGGAEAVVNHFWRKRSNLTNWGGTTPYVEYDHLYNVAAGTPVGTWKIIIALYQGQAPYTYNPAFYECRNSARITTSDGTVGCYVGDLTVQTAVPPAETAGGVGDVNSGLGVVDLNPSRQWTPGS